MAGQGCLENLQHGEDSRRARRRERPVQPGLDPIRRWRRPLYGTVAAAQGSSSINVTPT
ncbi:hypothetical protein CBM2633_B90249 [Cupriavidus taiwanensis]|nr:hypothetical protein CBM2633_B90249 [Cupriavidus taiwanensis]